MLLFFFVFCLADLVVVVLAIPAFTRLGWPFHPSIHDDEASNAHEEKNIFGKICTGLGG